MLFIVIEIDSSQSLVRVLHFVLAQSELTGLSELSISQSVLSIPSFGIVDNKTISAEGSVGAVPIPKFIV